MFRDILLIAVVFVLPLMQTLLKRTSLPVASIHYRINLGRI